LNYTFTALKIFLVNDAVLEMEKKKLMETDKKGRKNIC